jgi:hypothetical protein
LQKADCLKYMDCEFPKYGTLYFLILIFKGWFLALSMKTNMFFLCFNIIICKDATWHRRGKSRNKGAKLIIYIIMRLYTIACLINISIYTSVLMMIMCLFYNFRRNFTLFQAWTIIIFLSLCCSINDCLIISIPYRFH